MSSRTRKNKQHSNTASYRISHILIHAVASILAGHTQAVIRLILTPRPIKPSRAVARQKPVRIIAHAAIQARLSLTYIDQGITQLASISSIAQTPERAHIPLDAQALLAWRGRTLVYVHFTRLAGPAPLTQTRVSKALEVGVDVLDAKGAVLARITVTGYQLGLAAVACKAR